MSDEVVTGGFLCGAIRWESDRVPFRAGYCHCRECQRSLGNLFGPSVMFRHDTSQYANNHAELSHQPTRVRERGMRRFKSIQQAQRFLNVHAAIYNLFNLGRYLISVKYYRLFRLRAFASWKSVIA